MKFTSAPSPVTPNATIIRPHRKASVTASWIYCGDPGAASGASTAKTISDTALVGPETACMDDPNRAATTVGTMAQYRPYSGGNPASVAKATPCGTTAMAPMSPASASARSVPALT